MVYATIDDMVTGLELDDSLSQEDGLSPDQARAACREYAQTVSEYDELIGGFVIKDEYSQDPESFSQEVQEAQEDAWEDAVNQALLA